ncbi:MAG: CPBP family intramembrane metalloprotease [Acidimicrobiales bacterium]|nr:CPBP family intramembrane metalloprotease [Acidimicrobiales bacterium]RZV48653.1 MAG: CPBP family intramembrane metalloprotease [Acidimicrobiales bacterium]
MSMAPRDPGLPPPPGSVATSFGPSGVWGLPEAGIGWITAQVLATASVLAVLAVGDWSLYRTERPGGNLGRAFGQLHTDQPLQDDTIPILWQFATFIPAWAGLLGAAWLAAYVANRSRPGWKITATGGDVAEGLLAGVLLQIPIIPLLYYAITEIFGELAPTGRALALVDAVDSPIKVVALFFAIAVAAPVVEELFYRGLVQRALVDRLGPVAGVSIASLIFGAVHFSWTELPALTVVGLVLGWLYHRSGRLGAPIIAHMTFNAFTLAALLASA